MLDVRPVARRRLAEYESYGVPPEVQAAWVEESVAQHLARLREAPHWWAVNRLMSHGRLEYLGDVVARLPVDGMPWERRAYISEALVYWDGCVGLRGTAGGAEVVLASTLDELADAVRWIRDRAAELADLDEMAVEARHLRSVIEGANARLWLLEADHRDPPARSAPSDAV